ncbi:geranyltranstransferase protein [Fulvimarina pelagi HTCC2506]|uniref:Probable farnesyl diphosphate synthase n=1 Tax=Fulvimarina pelagi HTCC2506 TaxID=314231 RepID=Q0G558_9HYPH|nr:polyprenyl synthetase family protein [Fulvimarina pelagi]EAU43206.1 geranyltranstransferase protein [Fulvimarina pelagi HTCC2506]
MSPTRLEETTRLQKRIEQRLGEVLPACLEGQEQLRDAIATSVLAPGKRLRPLLAVLTAIDLNGDVEAAIEGGCAIELIHTASLVLDDLPCMDDATLRRGQPPTHVAYGEDTALLAVIAMISRAFELLAAAPSLNPEQRTRSVAALGKAVGTSGLVAGQFADLKGGSGSTDAAARTNALKTGALFLAAVEIGMIGSGAPRETRRELEAFARELGLAFQLLDDLLDGSQTAVSIGKDIGQDAGKSTIVSMIGRASTEDQIDRHMRTALAHVEAGLGPDSRLAALLHVIWKTARHRTAEHRAGKVISEGRVDEPAGMQ